MKKRVKIIACPKLQEGGKISIDGYKDNSKDRFEPKLTIPSPNLSMVGVSHPVFAKPEIGMPTLMFPGQSYQFPGSRYVQEVPIRDTGKKMQQGGSAPIITHDPNDPRLKAYRDSLQLNRYSRELEDKYGKGNSVHQTVYPINRQFNELLDRLDVNNTPASDKLIEQMRSLHNSSHNEPVGSYNSYTPYFKKPVQPIQYSPDEMKLRGQQLPTQISQQQYQPIDIQPFGPANYQSGEPGTFSPDEFHRKLGYQNITDKMKEGGKVNTPIIVNDPNDPRLQAYQDSLNIYNKAHDIYDRTQQSGVLTLPDGEHTEVNNDPKKYSYKDYRGDPGFDYHSFNKGTQQEMYPENIYMYSHPGLLDFTKSWLTEYKKPVQPVKYMPEVFSNVDPNAPNFDRVQDKPKWKPNKEQLPSIDSRGVQQLPIDINSKSPNTIQAPSSMDDILPAKYMEGNASGTFVPDEYHRSMGYPNKIEGQNAPLPRTQQYQQGGTVPEQWLVNQERGWNRIPTEGGVSPYGLTYGARQDFMVTSDKPGYPYPASSYPPIGEQGSQAGYQQPTQQLSGLDDYSGDVIGRTREEAKMGGTMGKKRVQIISGPEHMADGGTTGNYGKNIPGTYNQLSTRWNPNTYQAMAGVDPKPNPYGHVSNTLPEVPEDQANVNAEKQEKVLGNFTADGTPSLMNVDGPPHSEGGKNLNLPENSFVFSDTHSLKIKDPEILKLFNQTKSATPATIAGQYNLQKFTKVLSNPKSDPTSRKTAELMVANYTQKLDQLAQVQESMKTQMGKGEQQQQIQPQTAQYGGMQYQEGGLYGVSNIPQDVLQGQRDVTGDVWNKGFTAPGHDPNVYSRMEQYSNSQLPGVTGDIQPSIPNNMQANDVYMSYNDGISPDNLGSIDTIKKKQNNATAVPFAAPTSDLMGIANSAINAASIHRYQPWMAPIGAVAPDTTYLDPTRALAANQEAANSAKNAIAMSANSRANRATQAEIQGQAGSTGADIVGKYANQNNEISNKASENIAAISNRLQELQRERSNKLYEGNVIAAQQYDNSIREANNDMTHQLQTAWKDRSTLGLLNATSPYFYEDPTTGARKFKSFEAQARFNSDIMHISQGQGLSSDESKRVGELAAKYMRDSPGLTMEQAYKYARQDTTKRTSETYDPMNPMHMKMRESETDEKKFGGMTNNQLKKFTNGSRSVKYNF